MQEAFCFDRDLNAFGVSRHIDLIERSDRMTGLAFGVAKRREIMLADQRLCGEVHGNCIE